MTQRISRVSIRNIAGIVCSSLILSGCLMSESEPKDLDDVAEDNRLSGSVGDGPVVGAQMRAYRKDDTELAQFESTTSANYNITVKTKGKYYPLKVTADGGTDLVTNLVQDFEMRAAVLKPKKRSVANVNPFSTIIVDLSHDLPGGFSDATLADAQEIVSTALNSGLEGLATSGPMTTHIDEHNIAEVVRASEALAETVRRTRDLLNGAGFGATGDSVMSSLASDLTDAVVNGQGGSQTNARAAAIATIAYAQVMLETMVNELHVNGSNAQDAMAAAISQVSVRAPTRTLDELVVTAAMLDRTLVGIAAASAIDADARIPALHAAVGGIQPGMDAPIVRNLLPADYRSILDNALLTIAAADASTIDTVNQIASGNGDIDPGNQAPVIQGSPGTAVEIDSTYAFTPDASDPDGDVLTFSIQNRPAWATFDAANGTLSGTPSVSDVGTYPNIVIGVSDGEFSDSLAAFSIQVFAGNMAPTISGTPQTVVTAGQGYVFAPTASDANGDTLTFSIQNQPAWASFNPTNGRLSGAPFEADVGVYPGIIISVSDGILSDSLTAFSITVETANPPNTPPTIMGNPPAEVIVGSAYSFTPTASDADGDSLTFSITSQPAWASFDAATGTLSGTPGDADIGVYSNVRITVSDGTDTASIEFSITVNAIALGSVSLSWTPPTENEDGSQLVDLAGYKLYWGTTSGVYTDSVTIDNPSVTTYVVENLAVGTYEFVATSYNASGVESRYSNPTTKVAR